MKVLYKEHHERVGTLIKRSQSVTNPLLKTIEELRIRNTEIKSLDEELAEEERVLKQKRAELAAQEVSNLQIIHGLEGIFNIQPPTFEEVVNTTSLEGDDVEVQ